MEEGGRLLQSDNLEFIKRNLDMRCIFSGFKTKMDHHSPWQMPENYIEQNGIVVDTST